MSYDDPATQRRIDVSVGINNAAVLAAGQPDPLEYFGTIVADVVEKTIELQTEHRIQDAVVLAFPGTVVVPPEHAPMTSTEFQTAPAAPVQGYGQGGNQGFQPSVAGAPSPAAPAPVSQPAAIPGATDGDPAVAAIWQEFFANPKKFWDNRNDKRNPRAPDFKNKDNGDKALWLNDQKNPSWVHSNLVSRGLVPA